MTEKNRNKLYIEFRVQVDPNTNQDFLHEIGENLQDYIYNEVLTQIEPVGLGVTYEVIMEIAAKEPPDVAQAESIFDDMRNYIGEDGK